MIYSQDFLQRLNAERNRVVYARITKMSFNETPIEMIQGRVTEGQISLDGNSSVRRTCSLSMVTTEIDVGNYFWSLNTKFKLEVGLQNKIDKQYPDIIWFNQGIFLVSSFSSSLNPNGFTINIQGKDKMCQLNGEIGGVLTSSIDFGKIEQINELGEIIYIPQTLRDIIREMVHTYGGEPFHNIIINDLEDKGLIQQEYRRETPIYLLREENDLTGSYEKAYFSDADCYYEVAPGNMRRTKLSQLPVYDSLTREFDIKRLSPTVIQFILTEGQHGELPTRYCVTKIEYGQTVGYLETDLTYTGDLIAKVGETVTSVLDKIKKMLADYEYFYNIDGQFVFQKQRTYLNTAFTPQVQAIEGEGEDWVHSESDSYTYSFLNGDLVTAFNNTPNLSNLKNDYSVWGTRNTAQGAVPIHMRYAIHSKPIMYTSISVYDKELVNYNNKYRLGIVGQKSITYIANEGHVASYWNNMLTLSLPKGYITAEDEKKYIQFNNISEQYNVDTKHLMLNFTSSQDWRYCDWREIIYQMALDYKKYNHLDDFYQRIATANPELYPTGITGYEQYYNDLEGFWRQLYDPKIVYQENYSLQKDQNYIQKTVSYESIEPSEESQGQQLYANLGGLNLKDDYHKVYYNGIDYITLDNIIPQDKVLYSQEINYRKFDPQLVDELVLFTPTEARNLYILTDCGLKEDIVDKTQEYIYFSTTSENNTNNNPFYKRLTIDRIDEITTVEQIIQINSAKDYETSLYEQINTVTTWDSIPKDKHLYIKTPYPIYKISLLRDELNLEQNPYYLISYINSQDDIKENETYYTYDNTYVSQTYYHDQQVQHTNNFLLELDLALVHILKFFNSNKSQGIYYLNQNCFKTLNQTIKKLLYLQYCHGIDIEVESFLQTYIQVLSELQEVFDQGYNEIIKYNFSSLMTENQFDILCTDITKWLEQKIETIKMICELRNETISYPNNVEFNQYLFGPIGKLTQINLMNSDIAYPDDAEIMQKLEDKGMLNHRGLVSLENLITKINGFGTELQKLKQHIDSHSFIPTKYYKEVLNVDKEKYQEYFKLIPEMCYTISDEYYNDFGERQNWNKNVYLKPNLLNFWFDFLDTSGELSQFSVNTIGPRQKAVNEKNVQSIYTPQTPLIIFSTHGQSEERSGYKYFYYDRGDKTNIFGLESYQYYTIKKDRLGNPYSVDISNPTVGAVGLSIEPIVDKYDKKSYYYWRYDKIESKTGITYAWRGSEYNDLYSQLFAISSNGKTAKDAIDELLYKHSYCSESVSITTVPVYHLQPNQRIYIYDPKTGIEGEYIVSQLNVPLSYSGTMSITATKAVDRII